jgi:hypothetical protein
MKHACRCVLSAGLVAAAVGLAVLAYRRLPGHGGAAGELRYLLTRPLLRTGDYNRASQLLMLAEARQPGSRADLLDKLLAEPDPRLRESGLTLLADQIETVGRNDSAVIRTFLTWLTRTAEDCKLQHLPQVVRCAAAVFNTGTWPTTGGASLPCTDKQELLRWLVAGTMHAEPAVRARACEALAGKMGRQLKEQLGAFEKPLYGSNVGSLVLVKEPVHLLAETPMLRALLYDPVAQVRWAAGRLLVLAGEPAGVPAVCDWLGHQPVHRQAAEGVLTAIFEERWRGFCESGSPASEPGAGDGGD